ncbi:MAG: radical SAM protein [Candidatus Alcyoniella australis]|nr:radical SAM protein [Candidatus Alcyoniella australis]
MRVALIQPAERRMIGANLPREVERIRGINPPIGLMYVAAAVRQAGHEVLIIDAALDNLRPDQIGARLQQWHPDLVGVTAVSFSMPDALDAAAAARAAVPHAPVVMGGLQPFLYPRETIALEPLDMLLIGEGETTLPALLERLSGNGKIDDAPGLVRQVDGRIETNPMPPRIEQLDSIPRPARDLVDTARYGSLITDLRPLSIIITSRGCPFRCAFCSRSITGKRFRAHSAEYVIEELRECVAMGIRYLLIYDEVFTIDRERVLQICDGMVRERLPLRFTARATVQTVDHELLLALKAAGCDMITYGVEASDPDVLRTLGKPYTLEQVRETFALTREVGLPHLAYFMLGNPGETEGHVRRSISLARELNPDMVHTAIYIPYPATKIYERALAQGVISEDYWQRFAANPRPDFDPPAWPGAITRRRLEALLRRFNRQFYLRPGVVLRRLIRSRGRGLWADIKRALVLLPRLGRNGG